MKLITLVTAITLLKIAKGVAYLGDLIARPAYLIIDFYDRRRR
ncbi:hypothetical protein [Pararhizobium sp. O133]